MQLPTFFCRRKCGIGICARLPLEIGNFAMQMEMDTYNNTLPPAPQARHNIADYLKQ